MTQQLADAFAEASALSTEEQDALAAIIRQEIEAERRWEELLDRPESDELLGRLADEALAERRAGKTRPFRPDDL